MAVIEFLLALVGLGALIVVCGFALAVWLNRNVGVEVVEPDPYRDSLDALHRITLAAWDAAQQLQSPRRLDR